MLDVSALSVCPTCAVPVIAGAPLGSWFTPVVHPTAGDHGPAPSWLLARTCTS